MRLLLLSLLLPSCTMVGQWEHTPEGRAAGAARDNSIKLPQ